MEGRTEEELDRTIDFEEKVQALCEKQGVSFDLGDIGEMREFADDIEEIRKSLHGIGLFPCHVTCYCFWRWHSDDYAAGWLTGCREDYQKWAREVLSREV